MQITVKNGSIAKATEDVLIYSTNKGLMLSGGVGAALVKECGYWLQDELYQLPDREGKPKVDVGDVFVQRDSRLPWRLLIHTVVTDELYFTKLDVLQDVLEQCFEICDQTFGVSSIAISALGCGYGDCSHADYIKLLATTTEAYQDTELKSLSVYCNEPKFYQELCQAAKTL